MKSLLKQNTEGSRSSIDISPLLDVVFILLIFFVVTSTFTKETGLEIDKPEAGSASVLEQKSILLGIPSDGNVFLGDDPLGFLELEARLRVILGKDSKRPIVLVSDQGVSTGYLVRVMDVCKKAGALKISISAEVNGR
jgi:biopolymer transport protein ExbD